MPASKVASPAVKGPVSTGSKKRGQADISASQDDGDETPSKKAKVEVEAERGAKNNDDA